eukprot:1776701-Amphidinium_carterae.1
MLEAFVAQTFVSCRKFTQAVKRTLCSIARWSVLVICVLPAMNEAHGCRFSETETEILLESSWFWPDSLLDKDTFMELLIAVLSLEFPPISEWEKQLIASGALNDDGKVNVQLFVAASLVSTTLSDPKGPNTIVVPAVGPQSLASTSGTVLQIAASQTETTETLTTMTITSGDVQLPLPAPEVTVGVVVFVASKRYEIRETLGCGAGGSVHRASQRRGAPDSVALKLAAGEAVGFRPKDTKLAAIAVEAVAAAEVRRMAEDEAK